MAKQTALSHKSEPLFSFISRASSASNSLFHSHRFLRLSNRSLSFASSLSSSSPPPPRVTTAPLEFATPPSPDFDFRREISRLKSLRSRLSGCKSISERLRVIGGDRRVRDFFGSAGNGGFSNALPSLSLKSHELFLIKCLVASGQEHVLNSGYDFSGGEFESSRSAIKSAFYALIGMIEKFEVNGSSGGGDFDSKMGSSLSDEDVEELRKLLKILAEVEKFYDCIGGIIGYQLTVLELLADKRAKKQATKKSRSQTGLSDSQFVDIHAPRGLDLSQNTEYASEAALWGIEGLPSLGEIYPLGGSADRLDLVDSATGECLPAAMLPYCGRTLLEGLIRDLQAREFLYFKLYGKQCITPVAIMTSSAKNNHKHITSLCERLGWFGRGQSRFQLFEQPLVPTVSAEEGEWIVSKPFSLVCKPGGHGAIWKLAYDKGIFTWFYHHGRKGATVRQVSNVVAATDLTLLALAGIGLHEGKKLGFASCKRNLGATEGVNVLIEKKTLDGVWTYGLSCIEYTEFSKYGISEENLSHNSLQTEYPANTNILYVDLASAESVGSSDGVNSLPGMVLNTKKQIPFVDLYGQTHSVAGGRLECTMQNIADSFFNTYSSRSYGVEDDLDTFIVFNERRRVTSSAKKKRRHAGKSLHQTPHGSLLDILRNACDLLSKCDIKFPEVGGNDKYLDSGPPFLILLHPALGPLWEVTRQKFAGGSISNGSEVQIEVSEFQWKNVNVDGSLIIKADNVMGSTRINDNGEPILQYGHRCGRCKLENVRVMNEGINWTCKENIYWKHNVERYEACKIILNGNAEFEAKDVTIQGNHIFKVPDGYKLKITSGSSGMEFNLGPIAKNVIESGSWYWKYTINGVHINLELVDM